MAGMLLIAGQPGVIPSRPNEETSPDLAVAANFERFDGISQPPLDHPATADPDDTSGLGAAYGWGELGHYPRPGAIDQPMGQVYTPGAVSGVVGTVGGQPLPVFSWRDNSRHGITRAASPSIQYRLGVGQRGPSELGAAQTTALGGITNNPPQPGDLSSIIAGLS
jgi:hypothetical protein